MASSEDKKQDTLSLFEIKQMIEKGSTVITPHQGEGGVGRIYTELDSLNKKFEELRDIVIGVKKEGESPKKKNTKKRVIALLQANKRLNPADLGKQLGLSRVRANEYLKELENESIVKSITIKRKKFYMLQSDVVGKSYSN